MHGWGKIMIGPTDAFLKAFSDLGFTPPAFWFWSSFLIEMLGGISLILGLFTRFFAAAAAIEMLVICVTYWQSGNGFSWMKRGYEYVLLWGLLCFAIALWNGEDPILKERMFGLTGTEANHGDGHRAPSKQSSAHPMVSALRVGSIAI